MGNPGRVVCGPVRLLVICPHLEPDVAPTGVVIGRIVCELARSGHEIDVVTALPWYLGHRVADGWKGRPLRRSHPLETLPGLVAPPAGQSPRPATGTGPGAIDVTRVHPFPTPRASIAARAAGFAAFTLTAAAASMLRGPRPDAVLAMSPPLTLGLAGWAAARRFGVPLVLNVQDIFPDAAIEVGAVKNRRLIAAARRLERLVYRGCSAVTVLSEEMRANILGKVDPSRGPMVRVIPNFSDPDSIRPRPRDTAYRAENGLGERVVVMYAGNIGYSQPLGLLIAAARACADRPDVVFVVNGDGSARPAVEQAAAQLPNLVLVGLQPAERVAEVLASADIHVVLLKQGLAHSSVPSKLYSILAAGRPAVASVDPGTEVARLLEQSRGGTSVPPEDEHAFIAALRSLIDDPQRRAEMGAQGRAFVEDSFSAADAASAYAALIGELSGDR